MRTAKILKVLAHGALLLGVVMAVRLFDFASLGFWAALFLSVLSWVLLRLFAATGQLVYEIRNDFSRMLGNIERSLYQSNALAKEIRDLADSEGLKKNS